MGTYKTQQTGDILENAPIKATNFADIAAGILCRCEGGVNAAGAIATKTATIALSTAPTTKIVEAIKYTDHKGVARVFNFSREYLFSTLTTAGVYAMLNAEIVGLFGRYLVKNGNASAAKVSTNLVVSVTARTPFAPTFLVVDGVDIAFA